MQEKRNCSELAKDLRPSCTNQSIWSHTVLAKYIMKQDNTAKSLCNPVSLLLNHQQLGCLFNHNCATWQQRKSQTYVKRFYVMTSSCHRDELTHWSRVTHICVSKLTIIGSDNGLSPDLRQAIIWTNVGILLIGPLGTHFSEISIEILTVPFKKMCLKLSSAKRRPFCLGLIVLTSVSSVCDSSYVWGYCGAFTSFTVHCQKWWK